MHRPGLDPYILNEAGEPVPEPDMHRWGRWMETGERILAVDEVGGYRVSTVFLGIDHGFGWLNPDSPPLPPTLWESMVFGPEVEVELLGRKRMMGLDQGEYYEQLSQRRYMSRQEALQGHAELVAEVYRLVGAGSPPNGEPARPQEPRGEPNQPPGDDQGGGLPPR